MDCIPDLPRVSMLCVMFSGVPCGHDSPYPAAGGWGGFFPLARQKVFLRLRLGGWMTRNVTGDFRGSRWFYFFPPESGLSAGIGGEVHTNPFCRCYRRPSKRSIALWLYLYHGGILKYFIMRLDARRSFAGCCYLFLIFLTFAMIRKHIVQPSKKANGYHFNSFSDGPNWTRAFYHILFLNPSAKKTEKKPFCALSQTPFLSALFYSIPLLYSPTYPGSLYISLRSVDTREKSRRRITCCLAE